MTGSSEYASLGEAFTWTCRTFLPPETTVDSVNMFRNDVLCVSIGKNDERCSTQSANCRYTYGCLQGSAYTLTIPAEGMTENEQKSNWSCEHALYTNYKSPKVTLNIASENNLKLS